MLIIFFKGRPDTISLGVPTQGRTTAVSSTQISDDAKLYFAMGYVKDCNGNIYKTALMPDIYMDAVNNFSDLQHDPKMMVAIEWLKQNFSKE